MTAERKTFPTERKTFPSMTVATRLPALRPRHGQAGRAARARALGAAACVLGVLASLGVGVGAAWAGTGYVAAGTFGSSGSGAGQLHEPAGIAVDEATGDVYVYDAGNLRVQWFNAAGTTVEGQFDGAGSPSGAFTTSASVSEEATHGSLFDIAVDNDLASPSHGDVYVVDPGHNVIDKFSAAGAYLSQIAGFALPVFGVAVDTHGDVWVAEEGTEENGNDIGPVREYDNSAANQPIKEIRPEKKRSPGIAVDSEDDLYLLRGEPQPVKFAPDGTLLEELPTCGCVTALAANPSSNEILLDEGSSIARFGPLGSPLLETIEGVSGSYGVAVNGASGVMYATQRQAGTVAIFDLVHLPETSTGPASEVTRTTAKLEGEVNPGGEPVTSCIFEYGLTTSYGQTAPCAPAPGSGSTPVAVSATVSGLSAQSAYHYRIVARNANGSRYGQDRELSTPVAVEGVETGSASQITVTSALLAGSLEPNGVDAHYFFEYGLAENYGKTTTLVDAGAAGGPMPLSSQLGGLTPNEVYHFRLVGENAYGITDGQDNSFKTPIAAPALSSPPSVVSTGTTSAVLDGSLNPEHARTGYRIQYAACATVEGCGNAQSTQVEFSQVYATIQTLQEATGLRPETTYSYRLVADNRQIVRCEGGASIEENGAIAGCKEPGTPVYEGGQVTSPEATFTTGAVLQPSASTGPAGAIGPTTATIVGSVNPAGLPATYSFELGVYEGAETRYGVVGTGQLSGQGEPVAETLALDGLQPGVTYAYRIAIHSGYIANPQNAITAAPATFTTSGLPSLLPAPPTLALLAVPSIRFPAGGKGLHHSHRRKPSRHRRSRKSHKRYRRK